jgi:DNA-binding response OmpR family regulator
MKRVLIVEDEKHLAEGLRFNLEADGYEVEVAESGEAAIDLFRAGPGRFSLLILDIMLPGLDGFSVMAHLRAAGEFVRLSC